MKKLLIIICFLIAGFGVYFTFNQDKPTIYKEIDIGNPRIGVTIISEDADNDSILHDVKILDRNTNKSIVAKQIDPYHMIINDISYDDKYLIADFGTGTIRTTKVYDLDTGLETISFCNFGFGLRKHTIMYTDCTIDHKFDLRTVVENGEYNPITYKLNLDTLERQVVLTSDDLHKYVFNQHPKNNYNIFVTSVADFKDWGDHLKWKESYLKVEF